MPRWAERGRGPAIWLCAAALATTQACAEDPGHGDGAGGAGGEASTGGTGGGGGASERDLVVWVGAHPDDELYVAPWLAQLCLEEGARCRLLVMTRGEAGTCKLAAGCTPDLAAVRDAELVASAARLGAELVHWDLGDGASGSPEGVANQWAAKQGGTQAFIDAVADNLRGATRVVTFDPRHGDSCHPDHRAAGGVVVAALEAAGVAPEQVTLVASKMVLGPAIAGDPNVWAFNASVTLQATGQPAWNSLLDVLQIHKSQFTASDVATIAAVDASAQRTWLLGLEHAQANDPLYADVCP